MMIIPYYREVGHAGFSVFSLFKYKSDYTVYRQTLFSIYILISFVSL